MRRCRLAVIEEICRIGGVHGGSFDDAVGGDGDGDELADSVRDEGRRGCEGVAGQCVGDRGSRVGRFEDQGPGCVGEA